MGRRLLSLGCVLLGAALSTTCRQDPSASECHREVVERFGCCPTCDAECRAAAAEECAAVHEAPLTSELPELDRSSSSDDGSRGETTSTIW